MTGSRSTKRSLVVSIGCLVLCVAMLAGTTFAWFTDTSSTKVSAVNAGTLDVQLVNEAGKSVEGETLSFVKAAGYEDEDTLWEPGCTYSLSSIYVKNNGNLALKYKIQITGINGDEKLNDAIAWTISDGTETASLDDYHTLAAGEKEPLTISGHMEDTADNEYQGLSIDGITITVVATQDTVEHDSYNNTYDQKAEYPTLD